MRKTLGQKIRELIASPLSFKYYNHAPDYVLIGTLALIILFGLMMLSSASSVQAFQKFGDSYYFFKNQLLRGLIPGLIAFYFASRIDYRTWKKYAFGLLIASVVMLILVFIPGLGVSYGKAQSWLKIGPLGFQPTEIVKLTFLIYLATWLEKRGERGLRDPQYGLLPFLFAMGVISFLFLAQPDLGTLMIVIAISLIIYFMAGAPKKFILGIIAGGLLIAFVAIQVAPYRLDRFTAFFNQSADPQGIGYHISQAKLAVGSGGILGLGIGKSRQKFNYLPEVYGDSIFAVIAEEMGFLFSIILIGLFLTLTIRGLKIGRASSDHFGRLFAVGIISWFTPQNFINIGAMAGLLPLTGIPLPFISYGGTALTVSLFAAGILVNISKQTR